MSITARVDLKELYEKLCPKCQKIMEKMVKENMADDLVKQVLKGEKQ